MTNHVRPRESAAVARMNADELGAYSIGLSDAYNNVFAELVTAFERGLDIHWLRARISDQWGAVVEMQNERAAG
jgi:hypothetical protein